MGKASIFTFFNAHPAVRALSTAGTVIVGAKTVWDTGLAQQGLGRARDFTVGAYDALRDRLAPASGPPALEQVAGAPVVDVGLSHAQQVQRDRVTRLRNAKAAQMRAMYQQRINAQNRLAQQRQLAASSFDPSQYVPQVDPSMGFFDPSMYPQGFDPSQLATFDPSQMDPSQAVDPSMFVQGAFSIAGLPLFIKGGSPAPQVGGCEVGCAGKTGDPEHKPCGPCAAKAAAMGDVAGASEIVIEGAEAPSWSPSDEAGGAQVGDWVAGHWQRDPDGVNHWIASHDDGHGAERQAKRSRMWRWRKKLAADFRQTMSDASAAAAAAAARVTGRRHPPAARASAVLDVYRSGASDRIANLQRQLQASRDQNLRLNLQRRIDRLTQENAAVAVLQHRLISSTAPEAHALQVQLVELAKQDPAQIQILIQQLAPKIQQLGPAAWGQQPQGDQVEPASQAPRTVRIEVPMGNQDASLAENMNPAWQPPGGAPMPLRQYGDEWQGDGGTVEPGMTDAEIADYAMAGGDQGEGAQWDDLEIDGLGAAMMADGDAEDRALVAGYGELWDVPNPDAVAGACSTCPPTY